MGLFSKAVTIDTSRGEAKVATEKLGSDAQKFGYATSCGKGVIDIKQSPCRVCPKGNMGKCKLPGVYAIWYGKLSNGPAGLYATLYEG
ncbi:MAG: hypothetical protein LBM93_11640 [Oscillospiraceae bacterium]|jgi:hypothetical protein|nr:hypothetical protein [Oscillospiraceae bacterium]